MNDWIQRYIEYGFPIIPLGRKSKCPVVRGWEKDSFPATAFRGGNVGARAGERVNVDGKDGHFLIVDFDSPDLEVLRQLCSDVPLERTTCVRTGGEHDGYHLFYLTAFETRKRGFLSYRGVSIDLLGKGSFAVVPPSVVNKPYRYLVGLDEIAFLSKEVYETLVATLEAWKKVNVLAKHLAAGKLTREKAEKKLTEQDATPEMVAHFENAIKRSGAD